MNDITASMNTLFVLLDGAEDDPVPHPGFITEEEMQLAKDNNGVLIEITGRRGHSLTNGYVASLARKIGATMIVNSDTHAPEDLMSEERAYKVALGAGLTKAEADAAIQKVPFDVIKKI